MASARTQLAPYQSKVAIQYMSRATLVQALQTVAGLPDDAIVLVSTFHRDSAGKDYASREAVARIAESRFQSTACSRPWSVLEWWAATCSVPPSTARRRPASRASAGRDAPGPVPGGTVPIFDWWQLQRWGLDERELPVGSVLRFRQPRSGRRTAGMSSRSCSSSWRRAR
jgi:hypothetical protein